MTWNQAGEFLITEKETNLVVDFTSMLAIKPVDFTLLKPSWNWAGYFIQFISVPIIGQVRIEEKINLSTKESTLVVPKFYESNYQLKFYKADWIPQFKLIIYENDTPIVHEPIPIGGCLQSKDLDPLLELINNSFQGLLTKQGLSQQGNKQSQALQTQLNLDLGLL